MSEESSAEIIREMAKKDAKAKPDAVLTCTVLVSNTRIGRRLCGRGAAVRLPKPQAEALASLSPPRVRIDGV